MGAFLTQHWWGSLSGQGMEEGGWASTLAPSALRPSHRPGCLESGSSGGSSDVPPPPCSLPALPSVPHLVSQTPV